MNNLPTAFS